MSRRVKNLFSTVLRNKALFFPLQHRRKNLKILRLITTSSVSGIQSSFYDSQSGKYVELSNHIKLYPIQTNKDREEYTVNTLLKNGENHERKTDYIRIKNAFSSDEVAVQGATAICGDSGYSVIMLCDSVKKLQTVEGEDLSILLEECLWNDIDPPPMSERLGVRVAPSKGTSTDKRTSFDQANMAIDSHGIKHFEYCINDGEEGISLQDIKKILETKNLKYTVIE